MERIVIACYKPKPCQNEALKSLMETHWSRLDAEGLVSERKPILMVAQDGTYLEVFGWKSADAMAAAHQNPNVLKMWEEYAVVCDYIPVGQVPEAAQLFSEFSPG